MPIIQPGVGKISLSVATTQKIQGVIKADVNILRTVKGIKLPVRCYQVNGENVGSWYTFASDARRSRSHSLDRSARTRTCALFSNVSSNTSLASVPTILLNMASTASAPLTFPKRTLTLSWTSICPKRPSEFKMSVVFMASLFSFVSTASWLSVGDFDVNLKATVGAISACYDFKFAVSPGKP